jgi:hypothetical protein
MFQYLGTWNHDAEKGIDSGNSLKLLYVYIAVFQNVETSSGAHPARHLHFSGGEVAEAWSYLVTSI